MNYLKNLYIGIKSTIVGLLITLKYFFKKKVTICYPEKKDKIPSSFRGMHKYNKNLCIGCKICQNNCPVSCIKIDTIKKEEKLVVNSFKIDYGRCMFCAMCQDACPKGALILGEHFDISTNKRKEVIVDFVLDNKKVKE